MLTVIILTYNEEVHIERCIRSIKSIASRIYVVDSFSSDKTTEIASSLGAEIVQRKFKNQADQFNWALDQCADTEWIMRVDADEYIDSELEDQISDVLSGKIVGVDGLYIKRKVFFQGVWIRYGGFYPHVLMRMWRAGVGRSEQRWMDEHIVVSTDCITMMAAGHLVDENIKGISFWIDKHNSYATREAVDILNKKYRFFIEDESLVKSGHVHARRKRAIKDFYYSRMPSGLRAFMYFTYRYVFRLGFLDGKSGFIWHFLQGFWYRLLVDIKVTEIELAGGGDKNTTRRVLLEKYGIQV
jgi:glycosyltransferase involved in cell wall biosynthesis